MLTNNIARTIANKGIVAIWFSEILDRMNFYGLQSTLVLSFIGLFKLSPHHSYATYAVYVSLSYTSSILGGILADKILGHFYGVLLGILLIAAANIIFCLSDLDAFYFGLSVMIMGTGFLKPNNPNLLGDFCQNRVAQRDKIFAFFYLCINVGSIIGPLLYGFFYSQNDHQLSFLISAVFALLMGGWLIRLKKVFSVTSPLLLKHVVQMVIILSALISLCYTVMLDSFGFYYFIGIAATGLFFLLGYYLRIAYTDGRYRPMLMLFLIFVGNVVYLAAFLQMYSSVTLFINHYLNRDVAGFMIPTPWFCSVQPFFIILFVPFLNAFWGKVNQKYGVFPTHYKVTLGLAVAASAFVILSLAASICLKAHASTLALIFLANALLAVAELCIIPTTISLVNITAPPHLKGSLMGTFYFCFTFSGFLAGEMSKWLPLVVMTPLDYAHFFLKIALALVLLGAILTFVCKILSARLF